jgi:hypothetical protein
MAASEELTQRLGRPRDIFETRFHQGSLPRPG